MIDELGSTSVLQFQNRVLPKKAKRRCGKRSHNAIVRLYFFVLLPCGAEHWEQLQNNINFVMIQIAFLV